MALPGNPLEAFLWGKGGARKTPEQIARERALAEQLMGEGADFSPVAHPLQGLARVANTGVGVFKDWRANRAEQTGRDAFQSKWAEILGGGDFPEAPAMPSGGGAGGISPVAGDGMSTYQDAIAGIESGGRYDIVGPTHPKLGRALGKYQVMEANVGPWTEKHLGRAMTPEEFLASPEAQDAVFNGEFGSYVEKFGPEGAAQAWFAGPGGVGKMDRKDSLGTSVASYTDKFRNALGPDALAANEAMATGQPVQTASAEPFAMTDSTPDEAYFGPQAAIPRSGGVPDTMQVGQPVAESPVGNRMLETLINPQPMAEQAMPMQLGAQDMAEAPVEMAQAQVIPPMAGGPAPQMQRQGPSLEQLIGLAMDPFAPPEAKSILGVMIEQEMQKQDPMRQLDMDYKRAQLEQLQNPREEIPDSVQALDLRAQRAGLQPGTPEYNEFMVSGGKGPLVSVDARNMGEGDKFFEELDKSQAQMFSTLQQGGLEAGQTLVRLDRLEELLSNVPTGATANFKQIAGNYGIDTEGLDDIQAATALINQMVPEQRPAGSGPMSDADLELFKQSVPRIINQPGGNQRIIETMRGIATYTQQQGEIANRVANRDITPAEGRNMLSQLQNPLEKFGSEDDQGALPEGVTEEDIEFTMQKHGLTREQVLERLNAP